MLCVVLNSEPYSRKSLLNCCLAVVTSKLHAAFLLVSYNEFIKKCHKQYSIFKYLESALKTNDLIKSVFVSQGNSGGALKAIQRCEKTCGLKWARGRGLHEHTCPWGLWGKKCRVLFTRNPTGKQKIASGKSKLTCCKTRINFYRLAFFHG